MEVLDLIFISFYHKKTHLISLHVRKGASWSIGFPCNLVLWELGSVDLVPVSSWKLVLTLLDFIWAFLNLDFADQRNNVISWFFCYFTFLLFFPVLILDMKLSTYDHFLRWRTEGISPAFIFFFLGTGNYLHIQPKSLPSTLQSTPGCFCEKEVPHHLATSELSCFSFSHAKEILLDFILIFVEKVVLSSVFI